MEENITNLSHSFNIKEVMEDDLSHQIINYRRLDVNHVNVNTSVLVTANNVTVVPSNGKHLVGSSKVKLKDLVDYSWEHKFYPGQILAIHISGQYIAYGIQGKDCGIIRVFNLKTSERALIKGIEGMTQDVAFAFVMFPVLVACIDSIGDVYVYSVEENQFNALSCSLMLHIKQDSNTPSGGINRIVWCPYVPDEEETEDDDPSKLIVTRGNKVHVWNVKVVRNQHGISPVTPQTVNDGFLEIEIDNYSIVDVAFSPDGSTVALACSDGGIRFFQIDVQDGQSPVCIHDWHPHDGKPVSCLYFLDNHLDSDCHFWKFAVTGVEGNSEIKIWTCETWSCIQTIKYAPSDDTHLSSLKLKVAVDITANYILVSDMQRKLLHVLQLKKNKEETEVRVHVISEFFLSYPILSFGIVQAKRDYFNDDSSFEASGSVINNELNEIADEDKATMKTVIKLYLVQPRALHECIIVYNSEDVTTAFNDSPNTSNHFEDIVVEASGNQIMNGVCEKHEQHFSPECIVEVSTPMDFNAVPNAAKLKPNEKYLPLSVIEDRAIIQSRHIPSAAEEFRSDSRISNDLSRRSTEREDLACRTTKPVTSNQGTEDDHSMAERIEENGNAVVSTGSSPSREVQHILFSSETASDACSKNAAKKVENDLPIAVWPKIPIPEPENVCQNITDILRINNAEKMRIRNESNVEFKSSKFRSPEVDHQAVTAKIDHLEARFNQLTDLIKNQQQDFKQSLNSIQQYLLAHKEEDKKRRNVNNEDKFNEARFVNTISQKINAIITNEVEYLIKQEINCNVLPSLKNTMDTFGQQLHLKMSQHLSAADQQLREYIVKTVHKKSVTDALVNSIGTALPTVISDSFADVFCNVILPKFEKSCHEMFDQVNNLFVEGTREYINVLQNHVRSYEEKQCSILHTKIEEMVAKVNEVAESASFNAIKSFEPEFSNSIKTALEEQKRQLETSIMNMSRATPSPLSAVQKIQQQQEQIDYLLSQGKIDKAIEQVLSASDLKLLVRLCEKLDPDKVFSEPCKIEQHILLSFIQQLSVDLNIHTDLKHRFIEGAIMCLDRKHPICEINFPKILPPVRARILQFINVNPTNKNTRNMKILLMAVDSLLADKNDQYAV